MFLVALQIRPTLLRTLIDSLQRKVVVGLAHNDLHGGNLLVDSQGLVWLIDFATVKQDQHVLMDAWNPFSFFFLISFWT